MALDNLPMMYRAGQIAYELDHLDLADSIFRYELSLFPESVLGNYFRGRIAIFQDRPEDAKEFFWKLIEVADSLPDGYINLGMIYLDEDSLDLAIDVLKEGVARSTTGREEAQFYLATALGRAERYGEVAAIANTLVGVHPGEIRFLFMLGSALERQGEVDSAAVMFEKILKIDRNHAQTMNYLGYMWADLDTNLQRSYELIKRAVELDGDNPAYLDSYGWVLYRLGRYEEAETHLKRAIELMDDNDYVLYDHLAEVYIELGQIEDAKANWRKALELDPGNTEIKEKLAR
jgi:tetratricopeptide (TPR) repeat protein